MDGARKTGNRETESQIFFPVTLQELFTTWNRFPQAVIYAGGTGAGRYQGSNYKLDYPSHIISLEELDELHRITRTERYLEIGAMVTLNEIINLGKIVPAAFTQALREIAGPQVRNIITLGGHISYPLKRLDAAAPLIALDARYELRTAQAIRWISAPRFSSLPGPPPVNPQELLTRIRMPLEPWNYSRYKKFKDPFAGQQAGVMVFAVRYQKNILSDIRVVFTGETVIRDQNSETFLTGKQLPLDKRDAAHFLELWEDSLSPLDNPHPMLRAKMLNFIEYCILELTD